MFVIKNINNASGLQNIGEITVANLATGETTMDKLTVLTSINDISTSQFSKIQYLDISSNLSTMLDSIALEGGVKGDKGDTGDAGPQGIQGIQGVQVQQAQQA